MQCGPPNPPYISSWFQCGSDTSPSFAEHPYSKFAQCQSSNRLSSLENCLIFSNFCCFFSSFMSSSSSSFLLLLSLSSSSPLSSCSCCFFLSVSSKYSRSKWTLVRSSIISPNPRSAVASSPRASTVSLASSINKSLNFSILASFSPATKLPSLPSYKGHPGRNSTSFKSICELTSAEGSARIPNHGIPVLAFGFGSVPVTMEAPKSTGAENVSLSVHTRPPTRSLASKTITGTFLDFNWFAHAKPDGPAPMIITGFDVSTSLSRMFGCIFPSSTAGGDLHLKVISSPPSSTSSSSSFFSFDFPSSSNNPSNASAPSVKYFVTTSLINPFFSLKSVFKHSSDPSFFRIIFSVITFMSHVFSNRINSFVTVASSMILIAEALDPATASPSTSSFSSSFSSSFFPVKTP